MTLFSEFLANNRPIFNSLFDKILSKSGSIDTLPSSKKSAMKAANLRTSGNKMYVLKRFAEALQYYSESISVAPTESEELALAFGNRSAVLFALKKYELSLLDANRALKGKCPSASAEKLQKRKQDCFTRIQKENEMKMQFAREIRSRKSQLNSIERKMFYVYNLSIDDSDLKIDYDTLEDPMWNTKFDNSLLPNVSSKVKIETSTKWGRHWVAKEDIAAGEVLSIEKFLIKTSSNSLLEYCGHCASWCEALIPCPTCTKQMYCSERCLQEAYDSYHRVECKLLAFLPRERSYGSIALRLFLSGTEQGTTLNDLIKDSNVYARLEGKWKCDDKPYPDDYLSILNLNWKADVGAETFSHKDRYFVRNEFTAVYFDALRRINFFGNGRNFKTFQDFSDIELFAGFLLFHNVSLSMQYCGKIEIDFLQLGLAHPKEEVEVGAGIASYQTLMNHSCDGNTLSIRNKRRLLTCSLRPIKAGEQIFTTYGFSYWMYPKRGRAMAFEKNYKMQCHCVACAENWPTLDELMTMKDVYVTSNKKIIRNVKKMFKWLSSLLMSSISPSVADVLDEWRYDDLEKALEFNSSIRKYVKEPSPTVCACENFITLLMNKKAGNCYIPYSTSQILDECSKSALAPQ